jgi:hypothetical protein
LQAALAFGIDFRVDDNLHFRQSLFLGFRQLARLFVKGRRLDGFVQMIQFASDLFKFRIFGFQAVFD